MDSYSPIEEYRLLYRKIKPYHGVSVITVTELSLIKIDGTVRILFLDIMGLNIKDHTIL